MRAFRFRYYSQEVWSLLRATSPTVWKGEIVDIAKDFSGQCWLGREGQSLGNSL